MPVPDPRALPRQEGSPLDVDAVARGLAELEFDARVALPEAQERFKRAELERDQAIEIRENANALSVRVEAENRRLREELELAVAVGRLAGIEADRYRAGIQWVRGMCTDEEPHTVIDAKLAEILNGGPSA